jgi:hypothetical protein
MFKIDGPDAVPTKPAKKPPASQPGYFDGGDPNQGTSATMVTRDWLNTVLDELVNVIQEAEIDLDRNDDSQLLQAIKALIGTSITTSLSQVGVGFPVGGLLDWPTANAPDGFWPCDGRSFDVNLFPKLYAALGKNTIPNLQGYFTRGLGGDSDAVLVPQQDAGRDITGGIGEIIHTEVTNGPFYETGYTGQRSYVGGIFRSCFIAFDIKRVWGANHVASEFRPLNVAVLKCIKHD